MFIHRHHKGHFTVSCNMYRWSTQSFVLTCATTQRASFPELLPFSIFLSISPFVTGQKNRNWTTPSKTARITMLVFFCFTGVAFRQDGWFHRMACGCIHTRFDRKTKLTRVFAAGVGLGKPITINWNGEGAKIVFGTPITPNPVYYSAIPTSRCKPYTGREKKKKWRCLSTMSTACIS